MTINITNGTVHRQNDGSGALVEDAPPTGDWTPGVAPTITALDGSFSEGATRTATVTNLSANRSGQLLYENFEGGTVGDSIGTLIPNWEVTGAGAGSLDYKVSNLDAYSGTKSALLNFPVGVGDGFFPGVNLTSLTEGFFYYRAKIVQNAEGNDSAGGRQIKMPRFVIGADLTGYPNLGHTWDRSNAQSICYNYPNSSGITNWYTTEIPLSQWYESWMYIKLSDEGVANGARFMKVWGQTNITNSGFPGGHFASPTGAVSSTSWVPDQNVMTRGTGAAAAFSKLLFHFYKRDSMDYDIYIDQVFLNDSLEAVVIGNASTWDACTVRLPQKVLSRSGSSVQFTCAGGPLVNRWLYVLNADGYNSNGWAF